MRSVSTNDVDFHISVGDTVGVRKLIQGYGTRKWKLVEAAWYGGDIPQRESHTNGGDNKIWRHDGPAVVTQITGSRVYF